MSGIWAGFALDPLGRFSDFSQQLGEGVPISANLRRLGLYAEDLSRLVRRSLEAAFSIRTRAGPVKVAQYEVLGNGAKRHVRPVRDDRNVRLLVSHAAQRLPALVDRPVRDG